MASMGWTSARFLSHVLSGAMVTPADLNDLLERRVPEDQWLEYKDGEWLDGPSPAARLREYVSSFANVDGGVLIVGVRGHEKNEDDRANKRPGWSVTGCVLPNLPNWVSDALKPIAHFLSPPARVQGVQHPHGDVLVVGVAKAPLLVDVTEGKRQLTYLRNGHSTFAVSEALQVDLRLGRRVHPQLSLSGRHTGFGSEQALMSTLRMELSIQNNGLVWVSEGICGWVGYAHEKQNQTEVPADGLLRHLDVSALADSWAQPARLVMRIERLDVLQPFRRRTLSVPIVVPTPLRSSERFVWHGVAFVVPRDSPPTFMQIDCVLSTRPTVTCECMDIAQGELGRVRLGLQLAE